MRKEYLIIFKILGKIWMLIDEINVAEWFRVESPSLARRKEGDLPLLNFSNLTCMHTVGPNPSMQIQVETTSNFNVEKIFDFVKTNQRWSMTFFQRWNLTFFFSTSQYDVENQV